MLPDSIYFVLFYFILLLNQKDRKTIYIAVSYFCYRSLYLLRRVGVTDQSTFDDQDGNVNVQLAHYTGSFTWMWRTALQCKAYDNASGVNASTCCAMRRRIARHRNAMQCTSRGVKGPLRKGH